ncbi:tryptophan ABC transporter substrate-binding protein [Enterococcus alishanensis]|uniref:ABC transporter substrate-binding protein n=1 Tax=Enterococcus alishanensis TaxID=1303817 RepID=A0ABS6TBE7_9ENTE|nr:tryptophan ABC transporter substrate-binding protein [Enterococcus alishanensis]MBV7390221.1 ABC transporter substrate-binding protein [Enterococcus alishanensis]
MKNKGIIGSIIAIAVILIGVFAYQMGSRQTTSSATTDSSELQTVGILQFISHPSLDQIKDGVVDGLKDAGYVDGENIKIEYLNGQGDQSKLDTMSQQLISKNSDVLVGVATPAAKALANATSDIPVVMGAISDPVGSGLVKSLEEPGNNVTGLNNLSPVNQQIELAKELLPEAKTVGMIYSSSEENSLAQIARAEKKAADEGYTVNKYAISSSNEISQITQQAAGENDFLYIPQDNIIANAFDTLVQEADKAKIPVFVSVDNMVKQGGVATVGQNQYQMGIETGKIAAEMLAGADPAKTPVTVIDTGDTIINETKAAELGITIPDNLKNKAELVEGD